MKSIDDLLNELNDVNSHGINPEYYDRMITYIPDAEVIDRVAFLMSKVMDKNILDIGCAGYLHKNLKTVATKCYGIDQVEIKDDPDFKQIIIGKDPLPKFDIDIVICGEVVEHLSNPGMFLDELKTVYPSQEKIITVPNAFANYHQSWIRKGKENTNKDHVAYYSYVTMTTLLKRCGYEVKEFYWYDDPSHIQPQGLNEGMVFVTI